MQRPVMNPSFMFEPPAKAAPKRKKFAWVWSILKRLVRLMLSHPFGGKQPFRNEEGTKLGRFIRGFAYRLAFVPLILVMFLTALVLAATHPQRPLPTQDPLTVGVYYDPVNIVTDDGARLEGWLVPVIDAKRVLEEKELILGKRYPAAVLVHDFDSSREQLLPMVATLHEAGIVVLAINLRGSGAISRDAQTFGIREANDVKAAVDMLRRRAYVDPTKIALIGTGTGANACLIAGRNDPSLAAMVLADPAQNFDEAFADRIGHDHIWLNPTRPLLRWTFQIMYGVDTADLDVKNFAAVIAQRPVFTTDSQRSLYQASTLKQMHGFLQKHLVEQVASAK